MKIYAIPLGLLLVFMAGCAGGSTPVEEPTPVASPTPTQAPFPTPEVTPTRGPITLRLWLPPELDPSADTPSAKLFAARLEEFTTRRPNIHLEVRVKAQEGPGGLLDGLVNASAAAPLALPDLIALPRQTLEAAAIKGLLHPLDEFTSILDGDDWYGYSRQLARLQNSTFGLPFAGDALLLVHRSSTVAEPPRDLATALQTPGPLAFPAADPQALFTLALYQAAGGAIQDEQERPYLDPDILAQVLSFYQEAETGNLLPYWLTQYTSDAQAWEAFQENQAQMVATWASRYFKDLQADSAASPLPTPDGAPFTLATGWIWALASPNPEHQQLCVELAEFLTESSFLAEWTAAAGFLPTRPSALETWQDPVLRDLAVQLVSSAQVYPTEDILTSLAPPLERATTQVLKQQSDAQTAAQEAADSLSAP